MRLSIVGTGYVGIVSGACLADIGHEVHCIDLDQSKVDTINCGQPTCHENGLPELITQHVGKRLFASSDLASAVLRTEVTFIAVGTPAHQGQIDLTAVKGAAKQIGEALARKKQLDPAMRHTVVVKSTVIPGTTEGIVRETLERASGLKAGADFGLGMNPEFLTEGTAVGDFMFPDRLVLGGIDAATQDTLAKIYQGFTNSAKQTPVIRCNSSTAELIKYASNSVLATLISFSNELSRLAAQLPGVDIAEVMKGVHAASYFTTRATAAASAGQATLSKPVVAPITSFLEAGCGFGGSCLPKDVTALIAQGESFGLRMPLLKSVLEINQTQPDQLMGLIAKHYLNLAGKAVTVLGLAFKPDTDDLRESPAFALIRRLRLAGASITAYDPIARPIEHCELQGVNLAESLEHAVAHAQVVILVTRWAQFQALPQALGARVNEVLVVDGRRVLNPADYARYEGIGRLA